ncbi:MAG: sodium:proton antiporter, partial [Eggerthellaceae bacterium]|nr:sodium:proton antiporter [Eggerthellaceae bacterium]
MSTFTFILLLTLVVLASALISQFSQRISVPLIQITLGVILALFGATTTSSAVDPELFLLLFIAPLLYYEARKADKGALWENKIPIISLAIGLVVMIVLMVGFLTHVIEPSIPLAAALALGAALGPTDPVSVAALSKRTGLTTRQRVLLSGESLINDASGVVSFQFAVAALTTGAFSLVHALQTFTISFFGGIILGVALEALLAYMITKTRDAGLEDATFHVLFSLLSPFVIFLAGEAIHVSGILAVVSAGLMYSVFNREIGPDLSRMHIISSSVWQVLTFALNGVVFVLLGIQLPNAMRHTWEDVSLSNLDLVGLVFAITAILIIVRTLWFLLIDAFIRYRKKQDDQKHLSFEGLKAYTTGTLKEAFAMSLAGPKGAISLSIMMTLPYVVKGSLFEQRDLLIFLASGVILITLLLATFLLPVLVPSTKEARPEDKDDEILIGILRSVIRDLSNAQTPGNRRATQFVIRQYNERIQRIKSGSNFTETTDDTSMRLQSITWQRERMRQYMDDDCTSTTVCQKAFRRLQVQERVLVAHGRIHRGWAQ